MAAEALKRAAATMGHEIRVETQGSLGTKEPLTDREIAAADVVLLAADIHVAMARFAGKPIHSVSTAEAIRNSKAVIEAALALAPEESVASVQPAAPISVSLPETPAACNACRRVVRREASRRHHFVPDRHRAHLYGCGGVAKSGQGTWPHNQG